MVVPKLPESVHSVLGPVTVRVVSRKLLPKDGRLGDYCPKQREIRLDESISLRTQWQILYHEWTHMVLYDSGLHEVVPEENHEAICEVFGTARAFEALVDTWQTPSASPDPEQPLT